MLQSSVLIEKLEDNVVWKLNVKIREIVEFTQFSTYSVGLQL